MHVGFFSIFTPITGNGRFKYDILRDRNVEKRKHEPIVNVDFSNSADSKHQLCFLSFSPSFHSGPVYGFPEGQKGLGHGSGRVKLGQSSTVRRCCRVDYGELLLQFVVGKTNSACTCPHDDYSSLKH